jgi:pyruvate dehydrogenase (quinone)
MSRKVADVLWEMLANAGVKRCYGIVGDALNPVIDALRRNGKIEFVHVRHEEYGVFAAVAEAYLTGNPVVVCGTAGPGVVHLFNGLMDAQRGRSGYRHRRRRGNEAHRHIRARRTQSL